MSTQFNQRSVRLEQFVGAILAVIVLIQSIGIGINRCDNDKCIPYSEILYSGIICKYQLHSGYQYDMEEEPCVCKGMDIIEQHPNIGIIGELFSESGHLQLKEKTRVMKRRN